MHRSAKFNRTFLSNGYKCEDSWRQRLDTPLLKNIEVSNFAMRVQDNFDRTGHVTTVDMDIMANVLENIDPVQLDFIQNLFHRFRYSPESVKMMESTSHAYVRALLTFKEYDRLLDLLNNKDSYGIFLDHFAANMLLDHFIKGEMYQEAAIVAFDQMLQEDFSHPLTRYLSWYACHKFWKNLPAEEEPQNLSEENEEETTVLVDYIRPLWYDDHWDIDRDSLRLGKTLVMVTDQEDTTLSRSYKLIGFALWEKYEKVIDLMSRWIEGSDQDIVCQEALLATKTLLEELKTKETPEPKDPGLITMDDVRPRTTAEQKEQYIEKFQSLTEKLQRKVKDNFNLEEELHQRVNHIVQAVEHKDIEDYKEHLSKWCENRQNLLDEHVKRVNVEKRKREIADRLLELKDKEEKLSFFEQLGKISLGISRIRKEKSLEDEKAEEQFVGAPTASGKRH